VRRPTATEQLELFDAEAEAAEAAAESAA